MKTKKKPAPARRPSPETPTNTKQCTRRCRRCRRRIWAPASLRRRAGRVCHRRLLAETVAAR